MKFDTTKTKGGYKILSIHGPSSCGSYYGTVQDDTGAFFTCTWESDGRDNDYPNARGFDLIPLDEPKPDHTTVTDKLQYALDMCMDKLHDLDQRLALEMKRNDELYQDAVARVNGLRADYLADQSAVQPSRVDALEERLETFENSVPCDGWFSEADDKLAKVHEIDTTNGLLWSRMSMIKDDLTKRLEALEQRTQTDEKGVWVTRESLKYAFDATQEFIMRNDRFKELAERLGLEE